MMNRMRSLLMTWPLAVLVLAGCVDRTELWTIGPDGSVAARVTTTVDTRREFDGPDALPSAASGWQVEEREVTTSGGKQRLEQIATRLFGPGEALPSTYAPVDSPLKSRALAWSMSVRTEERDRGRVVHFARQYEARLWNAVEYLQQRAIGDLEKKLEEKDLAEWSMNERIDAVNALLTYELDRALYFAHEAFMELAHDRPQDIWLSIRRDALAARGIVDIPAVASIIGEADESKRDAALSQWVEIYEREFEKRLTTALSDVGGYDEVWIERYNERRGHHRQAFGITEALSGQSFTVSVEMPGIIIDHNADQREGNRLTWTFSGDAFHDRIHALQASSLQQEE